MKYGLGGDSPTELPQLLQRHRLDRRQEGDEDPGLANSGFQVNNSTNRYVLRVTITDPSATAKLYGITVQYVIGKGVPGAPA